jgi:radical SAM protein with 4Fe4S-binding SPASM domain
MVKEMKYYRKVSGMRRVLVKFLLTQLPFSKVVNSKTYNIAYNKIIERHSKKRTPTLLQIENTNFCNAKCIMCPHTIMIRKSKIMSLVDFKKIVDNVVKSYNIKKITITGFGEPLIDPTLVNKIKYVNKKYENIKVDLYTNASMMTRKISNKLLDLKIDRITFSVNGTKQNYANIVGLDYEKTQNNILYFLDRKKKVGSPTLTNISLMILKENEDAIEEFMEFWRPKTDSVRAYPPSDWAGALKNIIQKTPFKTNKRWPCSILWNNITVDVEGNVVMCCRDYESRAVFGNILKQDIKEIRSSKKFQELLKNHLNFNFSMPICNDCDNSYDSSIDWVC